MYIQELPKLRPDEVIDYLRKSQSDDPLLTVEEVLEKHESILDDWAERFLGGKVPEANKYREVVSGETLKDRPEINIVLRRIESPQIKAIKIVEPQRLTRGDLEDIGRIMKLLKHTNTLVITPQWIYDLRDERDWASLESELKKGNDYLEYYKKIQARGRLASVAQGNYLGSIAPYGYEKTVVIDGKKKCPTLKIKEDEANVVRMIFDLYVNKDMGRTNICHYLDSMGIPPANGQHWSPAHLKDLLENIHYIGKVRWNWRKTITVVEDGEIIQTRPKASIDEYLIYDGRHTAIISDELFNAAQEKRGRNHRAKAKTKVRNPFAGLIYCQCGRAMSLRTYKKKDGTERSPARLLCDGQTHCKTSSCLYDEMLEQVTEILSKCIEDFETRIKNNAGDSAKLHAQLIKNLEKKSEELRARELAQWEAQSDPNPENRMPPDIFRQLNAKLLHEKEEVHNALCKARESMPEPINYEDKVVTFRETLAALHDPEIDAQRKNTLLKACIERIDYSREKAQRITRNEPRKRVTVDGKRKVVSDLKVGGNWATAPIELDVKLRG